MAASSMVSHTLPPVRLGLHSVGQLLRVSTAAIDSSKAFRDSSRSSVSLHSLGSP